MRAPTRGQFDPEERRARPVGRAAMVCALAAALAGCGGHPRAPEPPQAPADAPESSGTSEPRVGGTITLSATADPKSFNPIVAMETSTTAVTGLIFEGLTRTNGITTEVEPALAESWEVSEDGLRWIFRLRRDVSWSDGMPFTSEDVVFTYRDLIFNLQVPSSSRDIFTIEGRPIEVRAVDPHTVEFVTATPFAPFLRALGQEILPAHRLRRAVAAGTFASTLGLDTPPEDIIGTGPFRLIEYLPGQYARFVRNERYWRRDADGRALPYLEEVRMMFVQSPDVALLKFQEGELDLYSLRSSDYKILKPGERAGGYTVFELGPAFGTNFLVFNQNRSANPETGRAAVPPHKLAWFTDRAFRRAVARAIDKPGIIEIVMDGLGYPQHGPMSPSAGAFYTPDVPAYPYDVARARAALAEAGYRDTDGDGIVEDPGGRKVEFTLFTNADNTDRVQIANLIRKDLERLGFKVHFTQLEFNALVTKLNATYDWDAIIIGLTGGIEPHFGKNVWHSSGHLHMWHPRQPEPAAPWEAEIDRIFDRAVQELDPAARKALYDRWQVIVAEELPVIYTVLPPALTAVRDRFGNLRPTAFGGALHNLEELYVLDGQ
ncbi:MAG TPA: ABC transporter substrate-binding protein [bacterium]